MSIHSFDPRSEALPPAQRSLWQQFSGTRRLALVLYGGTEVALRLGHRTSVDFNFFTERHLDLPLLTMSLPILRNATVTQSAPDTLSVLAPSLDTSIKISFFGAIDMGRAGAPDLTTDGVREVASLPDLLASKLKVLQQPIEAKDYQEIAAILRSGVTL